MRRQASFRSAHASASIWLANSSVLARHVTGRSYRLDFLLGYRYANLEDELAIREQLLQLPGGTTRLDLEDRFETENDFHGVDLGLLWEGYRGRWTLELIGRVALGNNRQEVFIDGSTATSVVGGPTFVDAGGLLALSSNSGRYTRDEFAVIPEFSATLGYALTPRLSFNVGYTFFYWNEVVRAGDQMDLGANPNLFPPPLDNLGRRDRPSPLTVLIYGRKAKLGLDYRW